MLVTPIVTLSRDIGSLLLVLLRGEHVLKGRRPLDTTGENELGDLPQLGQESKDGGVGQDGVGLGLDAVVHDGLRFNPGRNEVGGDADTGRVKHVGEVLTVGSLAGVGVVVLALVSNRRSRRAGDEMGCTYWWGSGLDGHVVGEAAVLVVGDNEENLVPLRAASESIVHLTQEFLTTVNRAWRVETIVAAALWVLDAQHCQVSIHAKLALNLPGTRIAEVLPSRHRRRIEIRGSSSQQHWFGPSSSTWHQTLLPSSSDSS